MSEDVLWWEHESQSEFYRKNSNHYYIFRVQYTLGYFFRDWGDCDLIILKDRETIFKEKLVAENKEDARQKALARFKELGYIDENNALVFSL